ncbi:carboxylating nicotinate-nucleotide diphosphorylase [Haloarcula sp. CBA1130]|uniref:carboxylating nicotinate-nucleotide diphosphorylase n=1 Tax=unclassified Haloarcula TaxID=2624677 RepID=UPI001244CD1C|nr:MULTISPECIES: carboxylating nicotinate-nucleotide diphosphorylase [unclassified Haloarcula]KAA9398859.1 carboxylating nicotinate-nucleotide diphosphorylase [Haloarcula sp. CBA1129]KAA9403373.1 carboxylating nicotinate-nucleotide diphosphorylase [Haloarcula sp. CBA1130]
MLTDSDIERWLREDVGHHDVTNDVPGETTGRLVAKESGVVAGLDAAAAVFEYLDCAVETPVDAGDRIDAGDVVLRVAGPAQSALRGERVAVNVTGHASGVATKTRAAVDAAASADSPPEIAGTRKTTPGLRGIEKRAVAAGGGDTHRLDLSHMVMVKDNHVAEMGLVDAVEQFRERASFATKLDVEVETPEDAPRAAEAGADIVLLDNMTPAETERAVELVAASEASALTEASGGITVEDVPAYAETGVDIISMGSLTHSASTLDFSFRTG